jgi:hypothetical protein
MLYSLRDLPPNYEGRTAILPGEGGFCNRQVAGDPPLSSALKTDIRDKSSGFAE